MQSTCKPPVYGRETVLSQMITSFNLNDFMRSVTCLSPTKECMYRECPDNKDKKVLNSDFDAGEQTWWCEWRSKVEASKKTKKHGTKEHLKAHLTVKKKVHGTVPTLLDDFSNQLKKYGRTQVPHHS